MITLADGGITSLKAIPTKTVTIGIYTGTRTDSTNLIIFAVGGITSLKTIPTKTVTISIYTSTRTDWISFITLTASGVIMGTVYSVTELRLGPYAMKNTQIAVLDFDVSRNIDGLLGMNVLGQFRFQIDQENARLLLNRQ